MIPAKNPNQRFCRQISKLFPFSYPLEFTLKSAGHVDVDVTVGIDVDVDRHVDAEVDVEFDIGVDVEVCVDVDGDADGEGNALYCASRRRDSQSVVGVAP